jgi:hypothetical protein
MTPFNTLVSMAILTLRARGEWQRSATSHDEIDRAVNQCADLLRGDDMPDLITLAHIESAIVEIVLRCGFGDGDDWSYEAEAAHERRQLGSGGQ